MLSVEHVRVRREGERLVVLELSAKQRLRALSLAEQIVSLLGSACGSTRDEVDEKFTLLEHKPTERRLVEGLRKLAEDDCLFEELSAGDPSALRSELFLRAASARRQATLSEPFQRDAVLAAAASAAGLAPPELERQLYADLRGAHCLTRGPTLDAAGLVSEYERAQIQAVLLRAVSLTATVHCRSQDAYRQLFQKLKFRRLLYSLERLADGGYRIRIDGPYSLFDAVTKYGLELSLSLPALESCDVLELSAEILWGKNRSKLRFEHRHVMSRGERGEQDEIVVDRDELRDLVSDFAALGSAWSCRGTAELLELPGTGLCVPDLCFEHPELERPVYFELLGYWSRDAVWRRVELVERGLDSRIVFGVSAKLRVSEEVLESEHAALYVFRGQPNARGLLKKLETLRKPRSALS